MDVYSPADSVDHAEECSKLHYFAEKDRLFEVKAVLLFCCFAVCLRKSARSAGDTGVSYEQYRLSTLACVFSRR